MSFLSHNMYYTCISLEICEFTLIDLLKKNVRLTEKVFDIWRIYISSFNVDIDATYVI